MADNRIAYGLAKKYGIDTTGMSPAEVWKALEEKGVAKRSEPEVAEDDGSAKFNKTSPSKFELKMTEAKDTIPEKERWRVDVHTEEDYNRDKLFTTPGGSCVAIESNGNIISVCKHKDDIVKGRDLLRHAIKNGGDRLDAFSGLYGFYLKQGFKPISWTPFDERYAPAGWNKERDRAEPIIFWQYTGEVEKTRYEDFIKNVKPSKDYDTAMRIRDEVMKK